MKKKLTSLLLVLTILFTLMPTQVFASNTTTQILESDHANQVHVIVENTTFTEDTAEALGASWSDSYWSGTLVDEWVSIDDTSTMMSSVVTALDKNKFTQSGAENNYIETINGLSAFNGGWMSGWMGTLNDWFTNQGFGAYTVSDGTLEAGDEIRIMYTCNWGTDLGGSWGNNDSTLKDISFSAGTLSPSFAGTTSTYTLTVPVGTQSIVVTPTANNKNFQTRTRIGDTVYKRTANVPVTHGTTLTVECNWSAPQSTNSDVNAHSYTINVEYENVKTNVAAVEKKINNIGKITLSSSSKITQARTAYDKLTDLEKSLITNYCTLTAAEADYSNLLISDAVTKINKIGTVTLDSNKTLSDAAKAYNKLTDTQKALVSNSSALEAAIASYDTLIKAASANALSETESYLLNKVTTPTVGTNGGEWVIIGLARNEAYVTSDYYSNYYKEVEAYVTKNILDEEKLHKTKSTENSRVIVALAAIGKDPQNVAGHNLLKGLTDMNYVIKQGINGPIWALIAFDTKKYEIPTATEGQVQVTRDALIQYILDKELANGGWALSGTAADPDMTSMALQALAPYYNTKLEVKAAIDRALSVLSDIQQPDGGYASWGTTNSESCAQVITALSTLGIDIKKDTRFIKNNRTVYDALMNFYVKDGGFRHTLDGTVNQMATEQAFYSIVSYNRMISGKSSLYDMYIKPTINQEDPYHTVTQPITNQTPSADPDTTTPANGPASIVASVPDTGDTASTAFYFLLLAFACGCIMLPLFRRKGLNNGKNS